MELAIIMYLCENHVHARFIWYQTYKKNYKIVYFNLYCTISAFGKANKFDFAHYKPVTL